MYIFGERFKIDMIIITTCVARLASLRRWIGSLGRTALTTLRPHVSRRRQISKSGSSEFSRIMNNILYVYCVLFLSFKIKSNKVTTPRGCPQSVKNNTAQRVTYFSHHDPPTNGQAVFFLTGLMEVLSYYISEL